MFDNFRRGWALFKTSLSIVWQDKSMLLFPITSGLCQLVIFLGFILGIFGLLTLVFHMTGLGIFLWIAMQMSGGFGILWLVLLSFAIYFPAGLISIYFNSALVACALKKLDGANPTVSDGLKMANSRLGVILKWGVLSFLVSLGLSLLGTVKVGKGFGAYIGRILQAGIGIVWGIAIYFVVPVIVNEGLGPVDAIKRSGTLIKNNWGEALGGSMGSGLVFGALMLIGFAWMIGGIILWAITGSFLFMLGAFVAAMIYWFVLGLLSSCVNTVLLAALYRYATTGRVTPGIELSFYQNPWWYGQRAKKSVL